MAAKASGFTAKDRAYDMRLLAIIGVLSAVWLGFFGWHCQPSCYQSLIAADEQSGYVLMAMK